MAIYFSFISWLTWTTPCNFSIFCFNSSVYETPFIWRLFWGSRAIWAFFIETLLCLVVSSSFPANLFESKLLASEKSLSCPFCWSNSLLLYFLTSPVFLFCVFYCYISLIRVSSQSKPIISTSSQISSGVTSLPSYACKSKVTTILCMRSTIDTSCMPRESNEECISRSMEPLHATQVIPPILNTNSMRLFGRPSSSFLEVLTFGMVDWEDFSIFDSSYKILLEGFSCFYI